MSCQSVRCLYAVLLVCRIIHLSVGLVCEDGEVSCDDGSRCIAELDRCDNFQDCDDNSDELNCETRCSDDEFLCPDDDICFPLSYRCDGQVDCSDGADEQACEETSSSTCESSSEFTCVSDGVCINKILRCDGVAHCDDRSDERACNYTDVLKPAVVSPSLVTVGPDMVQTQRICDEDEMDCVGDGSVCVGVDQLCDGEQQCPHGEDEDPARCDGIAQVWVANGHSMVLVNANSDRPQTLHVGGHILRISYDHATDRIFWIDSESHSINVMKADGSDRKVIINTAIDSPTALAYDWVHGVLYWADSGLRHGSAKIEAVVIGSGHRYVLFSDVDEPRVLVVDPRPRHGFMYWGESGETPCIYRAGLDGSGRQCISTQYVEHPSGITLDLVEDRLLWLDSHLFALWSYDLTTGQQILIDEFNRDDRGLAGVAVFEDWIYWAESSDRSVYKIHKSQKARDNEAAVHVVVPGVTHASDVVIRHSLQQPRGQSPCALMNGGCSHICLRSPTAAQRQCACPNVEVMYTLSADESTCVLDSSRRKVSDGVANGTTSSGPSQNGVVVGIVVGTFVMFIATVIGSVAD